MKAEQRHEGFKLPAGMHRVASVSDAWGVNFRLATQQLQRFQGLN